MEWQLMCTKSREKSAHWPSVNEQKGVATQEQQQQRQECPLAFRNGQNGGATDVQQKKREEWPLAFRNWAEWGGH